MRLAVLFHCVSGCKKKEDRFGSAFIQPFRIILALIPAEDKDEYDPKIAVINIHHRYSLLAIAISVRRPS
jgi:hypothetical protein